jgi:putative methylase
LGAGNGVLGIGAAFLGAKQVTMVECDKTAIDIIDENISEVEGNEFLKTIHQRVDGSAIELDSTVDIAIMNPPWGVQTKHADRPFFETLFAMNIPLIHFIHSIDAGHLAALAKSNGYAIHSIYQTDFRLPAAYSHHKQQQGSTRIRCYRLERLK